MFPSCGWTELVEHLPFAANSSYWNGRWFGNGDGDCMESFQIWTIKWLAPDARDIDTAHLKMHFLEKVVFQPNHATVGPFVPWGVSHRKIPMAASFGCLSLPGAPCHRRWRIWRTIRSSIWTVGTFGFCHLNQLEVFKGLRLSYTKQTWGHQSPPKLNLWTWGGWINIPFAKVQNISDANPLENLPVINDQSKRHSLDSSWFMSHVVLSLSLVWGALPAGFGFTKKCWEMLRASLAAYPLVVALLATYDFSYVFIRFFTVCIMYICNIYMYIFYMILYLKENIYLYTHTFLGNITLHLGHYMLLLKCSLHYSKKKPLCSRKPSNSLRGHGIVVPRKLRFQPVPRNVNSELGIAGVQRGLGNQWFIVPLYGLISCGGSFGRGTFKFPWCVEFSDCHIKRCSFDTPFSGMIVAQAWRKPLWHLVDFDSQDVCIMNLTQTLSS